jgi:hypothetical protein
MNGLARVQQSHHMSAGHKQQPIMSPSVSMSNPVLPIFSRICWLTVILSISVFTASCWFCRGLGWLVDVSSNSFPLWDCPAMLLNDYSTIPDGRVCKLSMTYSAKLRDFLVVNNLMIVSDTESIYDMHTLFNKCVLSDENVDSFHCYLDRSCSEACSTIDGQHRCSEYADLSAMGSSLKPVRDCVVKFGFDKGAPSPVKNSQLPGDAKTLFQFFWLQALFLSVCHVKRSRLCLIVTLNFS